jgi:flagellar basal-body rod modification protein FlgD
MINSVDPSVSGSDEAAALFQGLDGEAFLSLLIAQMRYQDPLEPTDASAMLQQTSQFASVEALNRISDLQVQLMGFAQFDAATAMIGKSVTVALEDATTSEGTVAGVKATTSGPVLIFEGGAEASVSDVVSVNSSPADPAGSETASETTQQDTTEAPASSTPNPTEGSTP